MIDVSDWARRLKDVGGNPFARIEGLAGLGKDLAASGRPNRLPSAYIYTSGDQAGENVADTAVTQRVDVIINATLAVSMIDHGRASKIDAVLALRRHIRDAWLGWSPGDDYDTAIYVGGNLDTFEDGVAWWTDRYQTAYLLRT